MNGSIDPDILLSINSPEEWFKKHYPNRSLLSFERLGGSLGGIRGYRFKWRDK